MGPQLETIEQNHHKKEEIIDGIFLKDACIGNYTGLMYYG